MPAGEVDAAQAVGHEMAGSSHDETLTKIRVLATGVPRGFDEGSEATGMMVTPRVADSGLSGTVP